MAVPTYFSAITVHITPVFASGSKNKICTLEILFVLLEKKILNLTHWMFFVQKNFQMSSSNWVIRM